MSGLVKLSSLDIYLKYFGAVSSDRRIEATLEKCRRALSNAEHGSA